MTEFLLGFYIGGWVLSFGISQHHKTMDKRLEMAFSWPFWLLISKMGK